MSFYELTSDRTEQKRRVITYTNTKTGTEVKITPIYKDKEGVEWFGFVDLFKIPNIRLAYARHIIDLFTMGLSLKDILEWCNTEKTLLKGDDPEKYEKLYSLILEKERIAKHVADPMKKQLALCTVYAIREDERIDYFNEAIADEKMKLWEADLEAAAFFLNWHMGHIQNYLDRLDKTSKTVLRLQEQKKMKP